MPPRTPIRLFPPSHCGPTWKSFSYDFTEEVEEGLQEFLRYAYYHGVLPDVPDVRWFGENREED